MSSKGRPQTITYSARRAILAAAMVFCLLIIMLALSLLAGCYFTAQEGRVGFSVVLGGTGLLMLLTGGTSLHHFARMFGAIGPLVSFSDAGLADQRVLAGTIPWSGLRWWVEGFPDANKSKIIVLLEPEYRAAILPRTLVERVFGHDPAAVIVSMSGIGAKVLDVAAAMEPFKPSSRIDPRDPNRGIWD